MSEETKHTPGPWRITTDFEYMRNFKASEHVEIQGSDKTTIGCCLFDVLPEGWNNASLIAAAPDLLEAAQIGWSHMLVNGCKSDVNAIASWSEDLKKIKAAIDKAKGES